MNYLCIILLLVHDFMFRRAQTKSFDQNWISRTFSPPPNKKFGNREHVGKDDRDKSIAILLANENKANASRNQSGVTRPTPSSAQSPVTNKTSSISTPVIPSPTEDLEVESQDLEETRCDYAVYEDGKTGLLAFGGCTLVDIPSVLLCKCSICDIYYTCHECSQKWSPLLSKMNADIRICAHCCFNGRAITLEHDMRQTGNRAMTSALLSSSSSISRFVFIF